MLPERGLALTEAAEVSELAGRGLAFVEVAEAPGHSCRGLTLAEDAELEVLSRGVLALVDASSLLAGDGRPSARPRSSTRRGGSRTRGGALLDEGERGAALEPVAAGVRDAMLTSVRGTLHFSAMRGKWSIRFKVVVIPALRRAAGFCASASTSRLLASLMMSMNSGKVIAPLLSAPAWPKSSATTSSPRARKQPD